MSVNPTMPQVLSHSTCELRFLELEGGYKKIEGLLKTVENLAKQLNELKTNQVIILCVL
jgi:hypothetical protein